MSLGCKVFRTPFFLPISVEKVQFMKTAYTYSVFLCCRYMCAHAISLNHPGIRCRCLAAYGDAVSAVKWCISIFNLMDASLDSDSGVN